MQKRLSDEDKKKNIVTDILTINDKRERICTFYEKNHHLFGGSENVIW
jgi:hypothetical protein